MLFVYSLKLKLVCVLEFIKETLTIIHTLWSLTSLSICSSWYHGMISRSDAERALRSVNCDCFLIRESQNRGGEHSLTLTHKGKVKHFRIDTKPGSKIRYELYGAKRSFLRLSELVEYYSQYCLSADGELLVTPYPKDVSTWAPHTHPHTHTLLHMQISNTCRMFIHTVTCCSTIRIRSACFY